jgi:hypothetical protein
VPSLARAAGRVAALTTVQSTSIAALTPELAAELAGRALANIAREYPNHPQYLLDGDADLEPPRAVHPVFFGCFDWHSAVHTHWLLVRLLRGLAPPLRATVEKTLDRAFVPEKVAVETAYLARRPSFERPYGLAWLTLLIAAAATTRWHEVLAPLATTARANTRLWLDALRYPVRSGTHNQTAFALTLLHDASQTLADTELLASVRSKALEIFGTDTDAPLALEPSGEDFLSPALMEADLLSRLLAPAEYAAWLDGFLPGLPRDASTQWLACGEVHDETDGKWVHLHGLNLSRAWNLHNIAAALPPRDPRVTPLRAAAERHAARGLAATQATRHYAADHWLPSFAAYLLTERRGWREP